MKQSMAALYVRRLFPLIFSVFLSACVLRPAPELSGAVDIYYAVAPGGESVLAPERHVPSDGEEPLAHALRRLFTPPARGDLQPLLPERVRLLEHSLQDGVLTLRFSDEYAELSAITRSVADAGLTLTLTQLPGVDAVLALCDALTDKQPLRVDALLFSEPALRPTEREITLYFSDGRLLSPERRVIVIRENEHLARYVVESLLTGTQRDGLYSVLPPKAQVLSVVVEKNICYVNFSAAFIADMPEEIDRQRLALAALVNSLTELEDIDLVQILVEDGAPDAIGPFPAAERLARDETAIASAGGQTGLIYYPGAFGVLVSIPGDAGFRIAALLDIQCRTSILGLAGSLPPNLSLERLDYQDGTWTAVFNSAVTALDGDKDVLAALAATVTQGQPGRVVITASGGTVWSYTATVDGVI